LYILPITAYSGYIFFHLQLTLVTYFAIYNFLWQDIFLNVFFVSYCLTLCQVNFYAYSFLHKLCSLYLECLTLEDEANNFLRNIDSPSPQYTTLHPT